MKKVIVMGKGTMGIRIADWFLHSNEYQLEIHIIFVSRNIRRKNIGIVFQSFYLIPNYTTLENVSLTLEINKISKGIWSKEDNPIINSPHTAEMITNNDWHHCYSREEAVFPLVAVQNNKYWPPVGRINNAFGDKNLFCSCPPIESTVS